MEAKIAATERLRREGRWDAASQYRDETRRQLRAEGKSKIEAGEAAWVAMVQNYPPLAIAPDTEARQDDTDQHDPEIEELIARADGSDPDLVADVQWVYRNIQNTGARATDAPSLGAWSMLKWAREAPNRFFEQMLPKALAVQEKQAAKQAAATDVKDGYADVGLDRLNRIFERQKVARQAIADLVENVVTRDVKSYVADWEGRFHLKLAQDARESMSNGMVKLADKFIKAYQKAESPKPSLFRPQKEPVG